MPVTATTRITAIWGSCMLVTLMLAGFLERRTEKRTVAKWGGIGALVGFLLIILSGLSNSLEVFYLGVVFLGAGTGLATVSNLSLMLDMTTPANVGLFIGAWGMANAGSRLIGNLLSGGVRDFVTFFAHNIETGYIVVFSIEALMLMVSLFMLNRIDVSAFRKDADQLSVVERVALANEA
jgi:MFS transporter, BCD family, chlorophyll transporter